MSANTETDTTRVGGLFTRILRPTGMPRGVFLLLHGMESHSGWFMETAMRLVAGGWAVLAYDRKGWGKSPGDRGQLTGYADFVEEAMAMTNAAREIHPSVHLAGMSWGGMAALYLALRRGWLFDSVALLAPGLAAKRDLSLFDKARITAGFFRNDLTRQVRPVFDPNHFTNNPDRRKYIAEDPDRVRAVGANFCFETLKMRRFIKENAGKRHIPPTLCLLAGGDAIIDNDATGAICRLAGVQVDTLTECAHTLIFDRPDDTVRRLSEHAASAARTPARGNVWIVGAGAVGGAVGSLLTFGGRRTGILVKPSHLDTLRKAGFTVRTGAAERATDRAMAFAASPADLPPDPELVVVAVKSFDTREALAGLRDHIPSNTVVASLQNGVGNEDILAGAFPLNTIVAASICASLELSEPGRVVWADDRGGMGAALHRGDVELAKRVWLENMPATGMECLWAEGPNAGQRLKWSKLMLNIGFNALNSATGMSSAALLRDPKYGPLAIQALREGFSAMGLLSLKPIDLPGFPVSKLRLVVRSPLPLARKVMSWQASRTREAAFSMRQDILKQRKSTEIQELNGKIVEICRQAGKDASANAQLVALVESGDQKSRDTGE